MPQLIDAAISQSALSCTRCRQSKRRCDRTYPGCLLCAQRQLPCEYPLRRKERENREISTLPAPSQSPSNLSSQPSSVGLPVLDTVSVASPEDSSQASGLNDSNTLSFRFLDQRLFHMMRLQVPEIHPTIPNHILEQVGSIADIQAISSLYFDTIHCWMPIISKKQYYENLPNRLTRKRAELLLLVLSMKLSCARIKTARTRLYQTVKQLHFDLEASGILSVQFLQSSILVAIYEIGHAIYPAAILSVGYCARYSACLGIDTTARPPETMQLPWIEVEEICRIWWSIAILDRFLNLCDPHRHPVSPDPHSGTYLPVDDAAWDAGTSRPEDALTIGSSSAARLARYGRFAQAAYLLTQALNLATEPQDTTRQLRRTIMSLVELAETEGHWKRWGFCTQMAICYSAVLMLENPWNSVERQPMDYNDDTDLSPTVSAEARYALQAAFDMISYFFIEDNGWTCYRTSPFISHFLYLAASMHFSYSHLTLRGPVDKLGALKHSLKLVNDRWLTAGIYLSLLEGQEILQMTQQGTTAV